MKFQRSQPRDDVMIRDDLGLDKTGMYAVGLDVDEHIAGIWILGTDKNECENRAKTIIDCCNAQHLEMEEPSEKCHTLYTEWACGHLRMIDDTITAFHNTSNINMMDITSALLKERAKLVATNPAYRDAAKFILAYNKARGSNGDEN